MKCDQTGHTAVFINQYGNVFSGSFHILEENICFHVFWYKPGFINSILYNFLFRLVFHAEVILRIQDSYDIICVFLVYRIEGMAAFKNNSLPGFQTIVDIQRSYINTMSTDLLHRYIIKIKYILDHFCFTLINGALLASFRKHHTDFFFCDLFFTFIWIDAEKPQHTVGRYCKKKYQGSEDLGNCV